MNEYTRPVFGIALTAVLLTTGTSAVSQPKAVLELFTSQGCSSCPPADKILAEYADRDDVLALSLNVDYWDYLGWKDTLASPDNSDRQRAYATARGDRQVYTPQIVVNGSEHAVGSNRSAIEAALDRHPGLPVEIKLTEKDDAINVSIGDEAGAIDRATLWLVFYQSEATVPIKRGENAGKTVSYSNVVKKLRPVSMWDGDEMSVDLPKSEMTRTKTKRCAVILQAETETGLPGPVLGAAMLDHDVTLGSVAVR